MQDNYSHSESQPGNAKSVFRLGITGGIGSGKTSVCRVFGVLGIPFFSADPVAKDIMDTDQEIISSLNIVAGKNLYSSGKLDRAELAKLIFNNPDLLTEVNALVHPAVFRHFASWQAKQDAPYVIMEAAILFESGASTLVDRIVTVIAPVEERIQRVISRNNLTRQQVMERIRNQISDEEKIRLSHYIINNSENDMIIPEILRIHEDIMSVIKKVN